MISPVNLKKPPRNSFPSPSSLASHANSSSPILVNYISEILAKEHKNLEKKLSSLSSLREKTQFSPAFTCETYLSDSSDIEEFSSVPFSPQNSKVQKTVHVCYLSPSWKAHHTLEKPEFSSRKPVKNDSTSSEELLLSTYEDSVMHSPPHCLSPTYVISNLHRNPVKTFSKSPTENIFNSSFSAKSSSSCRSDLIDRLSTGKKHKMTRNEMREINKRLYDKLPEVQEKKKKEARDREKQINYLYGKGMQEKLNSKIKERNAKKAVAKFK